MAKIRTSKAKKKGRQPELPKPRIPVPPPGYGHPSKKDYKRDKHVEIPDPYEDDDYQDYYENCGCEYCTAMSGEHGAYQDLMWLLNRLGIDTAETHRLTSYGKP